MADIKLHFQKTYYNFSEYYHVTIYLSKFKIAYIEKKKVFP